MVNWSALFDRGVEITQTTGPQAGQFVRVNQGGTDIVAQVRRDFSPETRLAGDVEYLSSYTYRLVFNDNYWQAVSSAGESDLSLTHDATGVSFSGFLAPADIRRRHAGDEARILHLPSLRYDVLDRPLAAGPVYWRLDSGLSQLSRAEPGFHAHNDGRIDIYPHISLPLVAGGWSLVPEAALRGTFYSGSQVPDLAGTNSGMPTVSHDPLHRTYGEASLDLRPPALERDFTLNRWDQELRHVIEPELYWHFVGGIGSQARNVLLVDTTTLRPIPTRWASPLRSVSICVPPSTSLARSTDDEQTPRRRPAPPPARVGKLANRTTYYIDPNFGGALIPGRRNVFDSTLDLTGVAFLTEPRNLSPLIAACALRPSTTFASSGTWITTPSRAGLGASNIFAGYSWHTTIGLGHAVLNAVDEQGNAASLLQSQQLEPFLEIGKQNRAGSTWRPTAATTSSTAPCSTAAFRPSTTGTAAA